MDIEMSCYIEACHEELAFVCEYCQPKKSFCQSHALKHREETDHGPIFLINVKSDSIKFKETSYTTEISPLKSELEEKEQIIHGILSLPALEENEQKMESERETKTEILAVKGYII
jgi:hypothetical protein